MHKLFPFLALLSICASDNSYFTVPETWNYDTEEFSNYVYQIGIDTVFEWYTDLDYAAICITCDNGNHFDEITGTEQGAWSYRWAAELPLMSVELDSGDVQCVLAIADYQTYKIFNYSQPFLLRSAEGFESIPSVVTSYILSTATMVSFTARPTATYSDGVSYSSDSPQYDPADGSEKVSSNNTLIGVAAGLGGLWGLTLLSLAGFCFYWTRKQRRREGQRQPEQEVVPYNPIMVPYHAHTTEPAPPFTSEMVTTRAPQDPKAPVTGRETLTALPSMGCRSTTHSSVVSELAG
ncbi:hypothetical protein LTR84_006858 [Exophiala bonariae]|uniref:Mid2 domain-containing protein n=1 Tax=Exophiala bonariae TaxID=1690606 RepID=A0AAV9N061_9EURO|nr:hypothetical protein LTR84_006858 [Exophiala bonariae]